MLPGLQKIRGFAHAIFVDKLERAAPGERLDLHIKSCTAHPDILDDGIDVDFLLNEMFVEYRIQVFHEIPVISIVRDDIFRDVGDRLRCRPDICSLAIQTSAGDAVHYSAEVHRVEWLADICISAQIQSQDLGLRVGFRGKQDYGHGAEFCVRTYFPAELVPVHHRHHYVADHDVEVLGFYGLQTFLTVRSARYVITGAKHVYNILPHVIVVLDNKDTEPGYILDLVVQRGDGYRLPARSVLQDNGVGNLRNLEVVRHHKAEHRSGWQVLFRLHTPSMSLYQLSCIMQPYAETVNPAVPGFIRTGIFGEDAFQFARRDTLSLVGNDDFKAV